MSALVGPVSPVSVTSFETVAIGAMSIAKLDGRQVPDRIFEGLAQGRGGWLVTANLDFLRRCSRDSSLVDLYSAADLVVADGMPLIWAARLRGRPLPGRVAGSDLVWLIAERAALEGRSLYLLGGEPGAAEEARDVLLSRWPKLKIAGVSSPNLAARPTEEELAAIRVDLESCRPDLVYVAMGSPKQEFVISAMRKHLPQAWMVGVGISLSFIAGRSRRAPVWIQKIGLEWLHRAVQEPRRLMRRYFIEDLPFSFRLLAGAWLDRFRAEPKR